MDLSTTIIPKSDQINAEDLLAGPMTVTVESVSRGSAEQPVDFRLVETPGRAYRPSKTMRRVIVAAWGKESDAYTGRRMTLYRDPDVKFGGQKIGGIKIAAMSHIDKAFSLALTETRGKRAVHTVEPLREQGPTPRPMQEQTARMFAALAAIGKTDKASSLAYVSDVIGRPVTKSADLTPEDVTAVTAAAEAEQAGGAA